VMDEASQATEPLSWIPLLQAKKAVFAGDPLQLPPTLYSEEAAERPSEPVTKPVETTDSGYSFSSLGTMEGGGRALPEEKMAPAVSPDVTGGQTPSTPVPQSTPVPSDPSGANQNPGTPSNSPVPPSQ